MTASKKQKIDHEQDSNQNQDQISFTLSNGLKIPGIGLGTWRMKPEECEKTIIEALKLGYKHFDCAYVYANEKEIGKILGTQEIISRENLFITSKLWNSFHDPKLVERNIDISLKNLQLDYLDLYLIHWPFGVKYLGDEVVWPEDDLGIAYLDHTVRLEDTWKAMEKLVEKGKTKSIGVSNFNIDQLKRILKICKIKPVINQIEVHPYLFDQELIDFCKKNDILITAYSSFGSGWPPYILKDSELELISKKYNLSVAQLIISWCLTQNIIIIPKTINFERLKENLIFNNKLDEKDIQFINNLSKKDSSKNHRYVGSVKLFKIDIFPPKLKINKKTNLPI